MTQGELPEHFSYLTQFYASHFPAQEIFDLLNITNKREFSFQLNNFRIVRFVSFSTAPDLKSWLIKTPLKIDLGCNYTNTNMKGGEIDWRELVIDIDMGDFHKETEKKHKKLKRDPVKGFITPEPEKFENVHFCGKLCEKCLDQMSEIIDTLNNVLYYNLGLKKIIFFFSGNKGFHCYVLDEPAKKFTNYIRESIIIYLKKYGIVADVGVSKDAKHLLKCPFVVHPKTGLVCLPIIKEEGNWNIDLVHVKDVVEGSYSITRYHEYLKDKIDQM